MAFGDLVIKADTGFYWAKQSAKGAAATALKGAKLITDGQLTPNRKTIEGVVGMGSGLYVAKDIGLGIDVELTITMRVTLNTAMSLLATFCAGTTAGDGTTTVRETTFAPYNRGRNIPYFTFAFVYGESAPGTGILPVIIRDVKVTKFNLKLSAKDAVTITMSFGGLNMGPGAGTETFTFDSAEHFPVPTIASNVLTFPSWWPAQYSIMSLEYDWTAKAQVDNARLGSPESAGIVVPSAGFAIKASVYFDQPDIFNHIWYGTNTPGADSSQLVAGIKEGAHTFEVTTNELIGASPLDVPYRLLGNFPDMQWMKAPVQSNSDPNMIDVEAKAFAANWFFKVRNNEAAAAMIAA